MKNIQQELESVISGPPGEAEFAMWRAVFALAHADGSVAPEELGLVNRSMDVFKFSEDQRAQIYKDITGDLNIIQRFNAIEGEALRAQFFRLARIIIWCDGFLHAYELAMIESIRDQLGDEVARYESELRWINRKPDLPLGRDEIAPEDETITQIMMQMLAFYKAEGAS